jgi:hypothetical protein
MITAAVMLEHLNCDVELNKYSDGTISLECNSCSIILFSLPCDIDDEAIDVTKQTDQDDEVLTATYPPEYLGPPIRVPQIQEVPDDMSDL